MPMLRRQDLRRPTPRQRGAARFWSAIFFPRRLSIAAKNQEMDVCKTVGSTHPDRRWLEDLCPLALRLPHNGPTLLWLTSARWVSIMHSARAVAGVGDGHPHQLRHGGASQDGMAGVADTIMLERGPWGLVKSLLRYKKPARYNQALAELSPAQIQAASVAPKEILANIRSFVR